MKNTAALVAYLLTSALFAYSPVQAKVPTTAESSAQFRHLAAEQPDLSQVVLTLQDLPPGFEEMPSELAALKAKLNQQETFKAESVFAFQKTNQPFQLLMGFTTLLPTRLEQATFDSYLNQSAFVQPFLEGFQQGSQAEVVEPRKLKLPSLNQIGNASAGWGASAKVKGIPISLDAVLLRRGQVGALMISMYMEGETPPLPISEIARKLDERAKEVPNVQEVAFVGAAKMIGQSPAPKAIGLCPAPKAIAPSSP